MCSERVKRVCLQNMRHVAAFMQNASKIRKQMKHSNFSARSRGLGVFFFFLKLQSVAVTNVFVLKQFKLLFDENVLRVAVFMRKRSQKMLTNKNSQH